MKTIGEILANNARKRVKTFEYKGILSTVCVTIAKNHILVHYTTKSGDTRGQKIERLRQLNHMVSFLSDLSKRGA